MDARGWDIGTLAAAAGMEYDPIYKIVTGKRPKASAETMGRIAMVLDTSVAYLMGITEHSEAPGADAITIQVAESVRQMGTQRKVDVLQISKELAKIESKSDAAIEAVLLRIRESSGEEEYRSARELVLSILAGL